MPLIRTKQNFTQEKVAEKAHFVYALFQPKLNIKEKLLQHEKIN
jgi:hypothetical protein